MPCDDEARAMADAAAAQGCDEDCAATSAAEATKRVPLSIVIWIGPLMLIILYNPVLQVRNTAESHNGRRATDADAQKTMKRSTKNESDGECVAKPKTWG
jgi:hypothetical protein